MLCNVVLLLFRILFMVFVTLRLSACLCSLLLHPNTLECRLWENRGFVFIVHTCPALWTAPAKHRPSENSSKCEWMNEWRCSRWWFASVVQKAKTNICWVFIMGQAPSCNCFMDISRLMPPQPSRGWIFCRWGTGRNLSNLPKVTPWRIQTQGTLTVKLLFFPVY